MKLPFFKSKKRKELEPTAPAAPAADIALRSEPAPPLPASDKPRKLPAEHVVDSFGYALAAVPSLGPTSKAWRKLGFEVSAPYEWLGCQAAHIDLGGGGVRFLAAADSGAEPTALVELVRARLVVGSGLFGWTWACADPHRSALAVAQLAESDFHEGCEAWGEPLVQIPMELTPAAATWLEKQTPPPVPKHANCAIRLDHLVLNVSASKAVSQTYERHFGLRSRTAAMNDRYYAFLKIGPSLLEVVGPAKPGAGAVSGGPWGLAFGSSDLDATIAYLQKAGVECKPGQRAVQGGRIAGIPIAIGGINLAFMGD
ncbi:MAG TPA: VOC family protein [Candidatus Limnocylindrales bacterium]|nr:VOC family protein [Candidatus Limnocylindrales bacterium]